MVIQLLLAKVLREELALRGIRSIVAEDAEAIATRIFEQITELELAVRDLSFSTGGNYPCVTPVITLGS